MNQESGIKNNKIVSFSDLESWKQAHKLAITIYQITKQFPKEEVFGLISQMRRCAVSITSNIAEGFSRQSYKEKIQFYSMALGSVTEIQNQLLLVRDIKYIDEEDFSQIAEQAITVHKLLNGLIKKSKEKINNS